MYNYDKPAFQDPRSRLDTPTDRTIDRALNVTGLPLIQPRNRSNPRPFSAVIRVQSLPIRNYNSLPAPMVNQDNRPFTGLALWADMYRNGG